MSTQPSNRNLDFQRFIVQVLSLIVAVIGLGLGFYTVSKGSSKSTEQDSKSTSSSPISTLSTTTNSPISPSVPTGQIDSTHDRVSDPPEIQRSNLNPIADVKCGSPLGSGSKWWPVNGPASAESRIKTAYCQDAYIRDDGSLQIASFTSYEEARRFAEKLSSSEPYQFRVGEPTYTGSSSASSGYPENTNNRRISSVSKYPLAACGSPPGSGSYWWAVKGSYEALSIIKNQYCLDALEVNGETQVASFSNYNEAKNFAYKLSQETGMSFWVKSQ